MKENKSEAIFHPVRFRIVQALFGSRRLTAHQLAALLGGPSIATLYRHLNRLVEAEILAVVEERPIRGAVEKVYALAQEGAAVISEDEVKRTSPEERMRYFTLLIGSLVSDFEHHLANEQKQAQTAPGSRGEVIRQEAVVVNAQEAREVSRAFREVLKPYKQARDASQSRHMVTMILLPVVEGEEVEGADAP